jgi:hypothetical protein
MEASAAETVPTLAGADLAAPITPEAMAAETEAAVAAAEQEIRQTRKGALKPLSEALKNRAAAPSDAKQPAADPGQEKATRRGFFSRLFGSREAHR